MTDDAFIESTLALLGSIHRQNIISVEEDNGSEEEEEGEYEPSWFVIDQAPILQSVVKNVLQDIQNVQLAMVKDPTQIKGNTECLICYDSFVPTELMRTLPCAHNFHKSCIDSFLLGESHLCPYCKTSAGPYVHTNL